MDKCCNNKHGKCYLTDKLGNTSFYRQCPYGDSAQEHCDMYAPEFFCEGATKVSSIEKRASWEEVSAKAHAIVDTGGVYIIRDDADGVEATVTSYQVADDFPVSNGGPYNVILSKRSWENSSNVGGWVQGYLCTCFTPDTLITFAVGTGKPIADVVEGDYVMGGD